MKIFRKLSLKNGQAFSQLFFTCLVAFFLVCMIANPAKFIGKSLQGLTAWATAVLPSVLPFMFFTRVLSSLNQMEKLTKPFSPISKVLFKTPPISIYAFTMAILSGYPVGSKMVADLYLQGKISREDAFKMSSFCSTSGPMFIVGAVGIGMFHNAQIGYILFLSHVLGAILNGIAWRKFRMKEEKYKNEEYRSLRHLERSERSPSGENICNKTPVNSPNNNQENKNQATGLSDIVLNSTLSILSVGCIITIFFIVIECFSPILSLLPTPLAFFCEGVIEITKGCITLATLDNTFLSTALCSFVISFGGISTVLQSITMLKDVKMPVKLFICQKLTHATYSILVTFVLLII